MDFCEKKELLLLKQFQLLILFMGVSLLVVLVHYSTFDDREKKQLSAVSSVTKFSSPSLSVAYYEPRILLYDKTVNPAYPQMQTINKMDLVYAE